jgi:hypothetical protein
MSTWHGQLHSGTLKRAPDPIVLVAKLYQGSLFSLTDLIAALPTRPQLITHASRPYSCFLAHQHDATVQLRQQMPPSLRNEAQA